MTPFELAQLILTTMSSNFPALLAVIAAGAGIKIVLDIVFKSLYNVTSSK